MDYKPCSTEAAAYALDKLGFIVTEENMQFFDADDIDAWSDAVEEYEALPPTPTSDAVGGHRVTFPALGTRKVQR